jgi:endonuclease/exonuclease/phosphatase family metal-dependent hydrolase
MPDLHYKTTSSINPLPLEVREAILREMPTRAVHDLIYERRSDLFDRIEIGPPPQSFDPAPAPVTITFWNVERGRHPDEQAALLRAQNASAHLLCELDLGMARTGQRHTTRDLAERLDCSYAFGVEFLELGLGNKREQADHAGEVNEAGLHGAAILSPHPLKRPAISRLCREGAWFDGERGERRIGGRIAVLATLTIGNQPVTLASVHLESHSDPEERAEETLMLLEAIDAYAPDQPVLIGGDFNTSTVARDWARGGGTPPILPEERVMNPIPFEPLFERLAERGYAWESANDVTAPTQRLHPHEEKAGPLGKIDWFFTRGLDVLKAKTVPAVNAPGRPLADHELLVITIKPEG